jgi:hypothetical protein
MTAATKADRNFNSFPAIRYETVSFLLRTDLAFLYIRAHWSCFGDSPAFFASVAVVAVRDKSAFAMIRHEETISTAALTVPDSVAMYVEAIAVLI